MPEFSKLVYAAPMWCAKTIDSVCMEIRKGLRVVSWGMWCGRKDVVEGEGWRKGQKILFSLSTDTILSQAVINSIAFAGWTSGVNTRTLLNKTRENEQLNYLHRKMRV